MSANDRPYHEEPNEADDYPYDDPYEDDDDTSAFPYTWPTWGGGWAWPPGYWGGADEGARDEVDAAEDGSWWDEGLFTLLIIVGLVLFVFPEPGTSMIGILFMLAGSVGWLIDALTGVGD